MLNPRWPRPLVLFLFALAVCPNPAGATNRGSAPLRDACDRPPQGTAVTQSRELRSDGGSLKVSLTIRSSPDGQGHLRYCYTDEQGNQAPTLLVKPGDVLYVRLKNEISGSGGSSNRDPCTGGSMTASTTNLHFHGLAVAPVCHQDETLKTLIQPGDAPFVYRVHIPKNQPPGLYWYHPHVHGFSEEQLLGGASGALIVAGIDNVVPRVQGLPERVFVIRDEWMPATSADRSDVNKPTKQLSINYVPVPYPAYPPALIEMRPDERELWRVVNASADTYLNLYVEFGGKRQTVSLVALDGAPVDFGEPDAGSYAPKTSFLFLPPGARAEFIVTSPAAGESGRLMTGFVFRGADEDAPGGRKTGVPGVRMGQDDIDAARPLASIVVSANAAQLSPVWHTPAVGDLSRIPLSGVRAVRARTLYFSEVLSNPIDPSSATLFLITEDGHTPAVFNPDSKEPNIIVHQGDVEDWIIENRSRETHTFHIHQLHFIVVGRRGVPWEEPTPRDTVNVPAWSGFGPSPSLTLRMDFRDPNIVGTVPFHCHIAQHLDGGMMGTVLIEAASKK